MSQMETILRQLQAEADALSGNFSHYQDPGYQEVHDFMIRSGYPGDVAAKVAREAVNKPGVAAVIAKQARAAGGGFARPLPGAPAAAMTAGNVASAANFTIKIERDTADLAVDLPFVLFGALDRENGYRRILNGLLPAGITLTSVDIGESDGEPEAAVFTYTDGTDTDTVTVTCQTAPYPNVVESTVTDLIETTKMRLSLSDSTRLQQFDLDIDAQNRTMFGLIQSNPQTPANFKSPEQFQAGIVDMDFVAKFDKQTSLVSKIIPVAGFSLSVNFSASRFQQHSARGW
jgi:hypothetical protein